jgi:hypothetical protein
VGAACARMRARVPPTQHGSRYTQRARPIRSGRSPRHRPMRARARRHRVPPTVCFNHLLGYLYVSCIRSKIRSCIVSHTSVVRCLCARVSRDRETESVRRRSVIIDDYPTVPRPRVSGSPIWIYRNIRVRSTFNELAHQRSDPPTSSAWLVRRQQYRI